ncbi:MAG TPA: isocitrate lyase, partial [Acidimicrobiaceae bacterium]|nr:isocitrate lyase [Acidimicrobiaceae bacterium]
MRDSFQQQIDDLENEWAENPRWMGTIRDYTADDVVRLRGSYLPACSLARHGSEQLWSLLHNMDYVHALGAMSGGQAIQYVKGGLQALYLSGWQVAGDANTAGHVYPDQSLYPVNSVPTLVERLNNALRRADQIEWYENNGEVLRDWLVPIVADGEAGFGGALNVYELMKRMLRAGAAGVHFEDQLASEKKCGHMGGKVLVPTQQHIRTLTAARLAADVLGVPSVLIARTDALAATLITSDVDERDRPFLTGSRTAEGFFDTEPGMATPITRGLAYAPYCDLIWC